MIPLIILAVGLAIAVAALSIALKKKNEEIEDLRSECERTINYAKEVEERADYFKNYALHKKGTKKLDKFIMRSDTPQAIYDRTEQLLADGFTFSETIGEDLLVFTKVIEDSLTNEAKAAEDKPAEL